MKKAIASVAGLIIALIAMFLMMLLAYAFLAQFFESTNEQKIVNDLKAGIELLCKEGPSSRGSLPVPIVFTDFRGGRQNLGFYDIRLTPDGIIEMRTSSINCDNAPGCKGNNAQQLIAKQVECPGGAEFKECFIEPKQGGEAINVQIIKEQTLLSFGEQAGRIMCV